MKGICKRVGALLLATGSAVFPVRLCAREDGRKNPMTTKAKRRSGRRYRPMRRTEKRRKPSRRRIPFRRRPRLRWDGCETGSTFQ